MFTEKEEGEEEEEDKDGRERRGREDTNNRQVARAPVMSEGQSPSLAYLPFGGIFF